VETKQANFNVKLAIKHYILRTTISARLGASFARGITRMFGVHHRNVIATILCQALMCDNGVLLWTFTMRNRRSDGIMPSTKHIIVG
jgi:hypothetical protein